MRGRIPAPFPPTVQGAKVKPLPAQDLRSNVGTWAVPVCQLPAVGSFLHDATGGRWQDYACGTGQGPDAATASGYLKSQVSGPTGFADLRQGILADAYRGRRVRLSADLKTAAATDKAGLYLRVIDPARSRPPEVREQLSLQGTSDWTRHRVETDVPADGVYLLFGITLTGPGQIWAANVRIEPA